jgi:predicted site-specific integrase-resolvase
MTNEQLLYTDKEAAAFLRISQVTLWRERKKGAISFSLIGSKIIYERGDLENYLRRTKQNAVACAA